MCSSLQPQPVGASPLPLWCCTLASAYKFWWSGTSPLASSSRLEHHVFGHLLSSHSIGHWCPHSGFVLMTSGSGNSITTYVFLHQQASKDLFWRPYLALTSISVYPGGPLEQQVNHTCDSVVVLFDEHWYAAEEQTIPHNRMYRICSQAQVTYYWLFDHKIEALLLLMLMFMQETAVHIIGWHFLASRQAS